MSISLTWKDIYDKASMEVGMLAPHITHNHIISLGWSSDAQHIYQTTTSVVRRMYEMELDSSSTDGMYEVPCSIRQIIWAEWFPDGDTSSMNCVRAEVIPWETLRGYAVTGQPIGSPVTAQDARIGAAKMLIAHNFNKIFLYPYTGAAGTLRIYAIPHLMPYSPGNLDDWASFGNDPMQQMKECGPEPEMTPALFGIVAYTKARMIANMPEGIRVYGPVYQEAMALFDRGVTALRRVDTSYSKNYRSKAKYGATR